MANAVTLRAVLESDLPIFFAQQLDPDARKMAAFPGRDHDAFMAHWKKILAEGAGINRTIEFDGRVAGNIVAWNASGEWCVGYWLGKDFWGRGIASAAVLQFLTLVTSRPLFAHVAKSNVASIRVLHKCGFTVCEDQSTTSDSQPSEEYVLTLAGSAP
jgi:RimJ/RimL family protein N-acetyltransferase